MILFIYCFRKKWIQVLNINTTIELEREFHTLHPKLRQDKERTYIYYRMTIELFNQLIFMIRMILQKNLQIIVVQFHQNNALPSL